MGFPVTSLANLDLGGAPVNTTSGTSAICVPDGIGTWGDAVATTNLYEFTSGSNGCLPTPATIEHEWSGLTATPAGGTQGYNVYFGGTGAFASTGIVSVEGTSIVSTSYGYTQSAPHLVAAATGAGSQSGTGNEADWNGWRLVANPFTCNMSITQFATDNTLGPFSISIWNGSGYVSGPTTIAPFQAFWIKLGSNQTLNFNAGQRLVGTAIVGKTSQLGDHVSLLVSNGTSTDQAHLYFDNQATLGFDNKYDGYKLMYAQANEPRIALLDEYVAPGGYVVRSPMGYSAVPTPVGSTSYPLIFKNSSSGNQTISIDQTVLPFGYSVAVEDKLLAPGVLHDITNSSYSFSHAGASADPLRFVLHVNASGIGFEENELNAGLNVWLNNGQLQFDEAANLDGATITVYNTNGQLIASGNSDEPMFINQAGVYIVNVQSKDGRAYNVKVVKM